MTVDEQTRTALLALLGDCSQPLEHRAPVTIESEPTGNPPAVNVTTFINNITNGIDNHTDEYYAQLTVNNQTSNVTNNTINNGFTVYAPGVSYFEDLIITHLYTESVTIDGTEYCYVSKDVVVDATLEYSFNSATCYLTLTLTLDKDTIKALEDCP